MGGDLIVNSIPTDGHLSNIFCPGAGNLPFDIIQHAISIRSLEPRNQENRKSGKTSASASVFWNLNTVHILVSGDKI